MPGCCWCGAVRLVAAAALPPTIPASSWGATGGHPPPPLSLACGKLYVRMRSDRSPLPICSLRSRDASRRCRCCSASNSRARSTWSMQDGREAGWTPGLGCRGGSLCAHLHGHGSQRWDTAEEPSWAAKQCRQPLRIERTARAPAPALLPVMAALMLDSWA